MTETLPRLLDCKAVMAELGVPRATAENLMRAIPIVKVGRRVFVRREDLDRELGIADAIEAHWRILTVHHLDGDKTNCRWWNLVALCQRCHLQIQGKVQMARIWPWEHSDWFKPYVAGYYAHEYLGEDLTRDEVMARLDELLGLERVA